ncbi:hypothetical protein ACFPPD_11775 [Cohnella suwonensis]|uniref:Uncharacterized protein n=1 Tax=Cohnella suwonensis TaxID=696072 RepID=A0ABW0LXF3_9BACL
MRALRMLGLAAPIATVAISLLFLYANPYDSDPDLLSHTTQLSVYLLLIAPALAAVLAYAIRNRALKLTAFYWSLPAGLYLGLAGIPSYWTLLILSIFLYLFIPTAPIPRQQHANCKSAG